MLFEAPRRLQRFRDRRGMAHTIPNSDVGFRRDGKFKIDAATTPKRIDFIPSEDTDAGKTYRGIYQLDGDTYSVCFAPPGKDRPTHFASEPGSLYTLHVWKRAGKS